MKIKFFFLGTFIALLVFGTTAKAQDSKIDKNYIAENFCMTKGLAVKISENKYVKQIYAKDYKSQDNSVVAGFSIGEDMFVDNGTSNDKVANDGIYTSIDIYDSKENLGEVKVLFEQSLFSSTGFKFKNELQYDLAKTSGKIGFGVSCDFSSCTCAECHCRACDHGWGQSLNWCFKVTSCSISLGWK